MASVEKRVRGGKVTYYARWRDAAGKSRSQAFARKVDADRHKAKVEHDLHRGAYVDLSSKLTVAEYARHRLEVKRLGYQFSTMANKETWIKCRLEATPLGAMPIAKVRRSHVESWAVAQVNREGSDGRAYTDAGRRIGGLGPLTLTIQTGYLRSLFSAAVRDGLAAGNPVPPVKELSLPKAAREKYVPLTVAQVRELAAAMPPHCRAMVLAQAGLGVRLGELLALRVTDVNFLRREVHVMHQLELKTLKRIPPKYHSARTVPLARPVADALAAHIADFPPEPADGLLFYPAAKIPGRPRMRTARPGHYESTYGRTFRRAVKRAGLPAGMSSHDLRHHYASVLVAAGESVFAVAERLGHTTAKLVLDTYGHLMPGTEETSRQAIEAAWERDAAAGE